MDNESIRILIVEDSLTQAERLRYALESRGFGVRIAGSGSEALRLIESSRPTLVISDILMPGMDGYQLCERIRASAELGELPIMLLTTLSDPEDILRALECGADNFITKPYDDEALVSRIELFFQNRELRGAAGDKPSVEVLFKERLYHVKAKRHRIIDLLLSTYESVVKNNRELIETQNEMRELNFRLGQLLEEKDRLYEKTLELSLRDALTGLANRRLLDIIIERVSAEARRSAKPFAVLMLDADHFKIYNDTHGHAAGDQVLVEIGRIMSAQIRETDLAARYGGEEFIAVLSDEDLPGALQVAERIRFAVAAETSITVSIGVAGWYRGVETGDLVKQADEALYRAKQAGRNRVAGG